MHQDHQLPYGSQVSEPALHAHSEGEEEAAFKAVDGPEIPSHLMAEGGSHLELCFVHRPTHPHCSPGTAPPPCG